MLLWQKVGGSRAKNALRYNGIDTDVHCGTSLNLIDTSFSVSIWAKGSMLSGISAVLFGNGIPTPNKVLYFALTPTNWVSFFSNDFDSPTTYPDTDNYHHWVAIFADEIMTRTKLYRDGVEITSDVTAIPFWNDSNAPLIIGYATWQSPADHFNGNIDEVLLFIWLYRLWKAKIYIRWVSLNVDLNYSLDAQK